MTTQHSAPEMLSAEVERLLSAVRGCHPQAVNSVRLYITALTTAKEEAEAKCGVLAAVAEEMRAASLTETTLKESAARRSQARQRVADALHDLPAAVVAERERVKALESALAEARSQARTPGTVEVCEKCGRHPATGRAICNSMNNRSCPIRSGKA